MPTTQDEKHAEQPNYDPKPDKTPPENYSAETNLRRKFLKTAIAIGLGGILIGKKALAEGLEKLTGESTEYSELRRVTGYYSEKEHNSECKPDNTCSPYCKPCDPSDCHPCYPNCQPGCDPCNPNCPPNNRCYPNECGPDGP